MPTPPPSPLALSLQASSTASSQSPSPSPAGTQSLPSPTLPSLPSQSTTSPSSAPSPVPSPAPNSSTASSQSQASLPTTMKDLSREVPVFNAKFFENNPSIDFNEFWKDCRITIPQSVRIAYSAINSVTGSIGGNGAGGPIYGESTVGSFQWIIAALIVFADFGPQSRFIDIGCGLGKPNTHVAQFPGVAFNVGVEVQRIRWFLSLANQSKVLEEAKRQMNKQVKDNVNISHNYTLLNRDISEAESFEPFTHVYMFDIG